MTTANTRNILAGAVLAGCACCAQAAESAIPVPPAQDSTERTSPPDGCSDREVNCVINDAPPPRPPLVRTRPATAPAVAAPSSSSAPAAVERARDAPAPATVNR